MAQRLFRVGSLRRHFRRTQFLPFLPALDPRSFGDDVRVSNPHQHPEEELRQSVEDVSSSPDFQCHWMRRRPPWFCDLVGDVRLRHVAISRRRIQQEIRHEFLGGLVLVAALRDSFPAQSQRDPWGSPRSLGVVSPIFDPQPTSHLKTVLSCIHTLWSQQTFTTSLV